MNAPVTFDTLAFVRKLEASGMAVAQAEALAEALGEIVFETTATKSDLRDVTVGIATEVRDATGGVRTELHDATFDLRKDLRETEARLSIDIQKVATDVRELELRLTIRLGAAIAASTALTVAILGALITWHH